MVHHHASATRERGADERSRMNAPSGNKKRSMDLFCVARDAILGLLELAKSGDENAELALWKTASASNSIVSHLLPNPSPLLRAEIERSPCCPTNLPANRRARETLVSDLAKLGLAKNCEINIQGKFDLKAPMSKVVFFTYMYCLRPLRQNPLHPGPENFDGKPGPFPGWNEWAEVNAAKIPQDLTLENARRWADLAEPLLTIFCGERFERHRIFTTYRTSKAMKGATAGTLRGELLRMWRQSWHSLVNK
jgi:hypothetical protein